MKIRNIFNSHVNFDMIRDSWIRYEKKVQKHKLFNKCQGYSTVSLENNRMKRWFKEKIERTQNSMRRIVFNLNSFASSFVSSNNLFNYFTDKYRLGENRWIGATIKITRKIKKKKKKENKQIKCSTSSVPQRTSY